jgi:hypothetical protein
MYVTVQSLSIITTGEQRSCQGTLTLELFAPNSDTPCVSHPVHLGAITEGTVLPLGFRLDTKRCGGGTVRLLATLTAECPAGWLQRWWRKVETTRQGIAEGLQILGPGTAGQTVEMVLRVPEGVALIGQRNMEADPIIDSDLGDPRLALAAGDPNGSLTLAVSM